MVAIGNPIVGVLHPNTWSRPAGNTDMKVTKTAAQHLTTGPAALDIGDGAPDLDAILAPRDSVVAQALTVGSANLSLDFQAEGKQWRIVLAHNTLPHPVSVGQRVSEGQQVGRMGATGATAIHLHIQLGWLNGSTWLWVDPWPYLRQNGAVDQEADMDPSFSPKPNRTVTVLAGARHRTSPDHLSTTNIAIASDPGGPLGGALNLALMGTVVGSVFNGNSIWYAYWRPETKKVYYIHTGGCGPETPWESVGHSDQELAEAVRAAKHEAATVVSDAADSAASKYPA